MNIKKTYIKRPGWARVIRRSQIILPTEDKPGAVSLLRFDEITKPFIRDYGDGNIIPIISNGTYWLQLGYDGENYFYTAMFDENKNFRQVYIDVTEGNICVPPEDAHFYDLFLDIVYSGDGKIYVLDRDELDEAKNDGTISAGLYENVIFLANEKTAELEKHGGKFIVELQRLFDKLVKLL